MPKVLSNAYEAAIIKAVLQTPVELGCRGSARTFAGLIVRVER